MAQKKDEGEFFPTTHQLLKHPLANLALVPKDAALFAAGAIAGAAAKTVSSSLCRASDYPTEYGGACIQMRLSYSPCVHIFLFLVQWTDGHLAGVLGFLRIHIFKVYEDGRTTMSVHKRKCVMFPSLLQLQRVIIEVEDRKQREICAKEYRRRDEMDKDKLSEIDIEREEECGICMEMNSKVVLPSCNHSLCMKCYRNWCARSQSCPFCRDSLKGVNSGDLWIYTCRCEIIELSAIAKENLKRLFMYIEKLPLLLPDALLVSYVILSSDERILGYSDGIG